MTSADTCGADQAFAPDLAPVVIMHYESVTGLAIILTEENDPPEDRLDDACSAIRALLPNAVTNVVNSMGGGKAIIVLIQGGQHDPGFNAERRKALADLVKPKFPHVVGAVARMLRKGDDHIATIVDISADYCDEFPGGRDMVDALPEIPGVKGLRIDETGQFLRFGLSRPLDDDPQTVTAAVVAAVGMYLRGTVAVKDPATASA